jgi:hypothetical protein
VTTSGWGQLKKKMFFFENPKGQGGPASAGSIIITGKTQMIAAWFKTYIPHYLVFRVALAFA